MWRFRASALLVAGGTLAAQLPPSERLSERDQPLFHAEISRLEALLVSAPGKPEVTYQIARTYAYANQWPETIQWLRRVVAFRAGLDPSRDAIFAKLRGTREFEPILASIQNATPPVSRSDAALRVSEADLVPESLAYDPAGKEFYFGSMRQGKVVRCSADGACTTFTSGLGTILGIKVRGNSLWLLDNSETESALVRFDLRTGQMIRRYTVAETKHTFNDLVFGPSGEVYLTDTSAGAVWRLPEGGTDLVKVPGTFPAANGITISPDGRLLYVSTFPDGIIVVDLTTSAAQPIARPKGLCLATIDGLYFFRNELIAIQNGFMTPRVIRLPLSRDLRRIAGFEVLERRNPLFDGVTTGVIVGQSFYYMANIQDDKKSGFNPITVLRMGLPF